MDGLFDTYFDDSISTGTDAFDEESLVTEQTSDSTPLEFYNQTFAEIQVEKGQYGIFLLHQTRYMRKIEPLPAACDFYAFLSLSHNQASLCNTLPDLRAPENLMGKVTSHTFEGRNMTVMKNIVTRAQFERNRVLLQ